MAFTIGSDLVFLKAAFNVRWHLKIGFYMALTCVRLELKISIAETKSYIFCVVASKNPPNELRPLNYL